MRVGFDLKIRAGREGQFDGAVFRFHLDIVGGRRGGLQGDLAVAVGDVQAVFELVDGDVLLAGGNFEGAVDAIHFQGADLHVQSPGELLRGHVGSQRFVAQRLADIAELEGAAELAVNGDRVGDVGDLDIVAAAVEFHAAFHPADFRGAAGFVDFHQALDIGGAHITLLGGERLVAVQTVHRNVAALGARLRCSSLGERAGSGRP